MSTIATVTDIFTQGFIEVALWEGGKPGNIRCVAETSKKHRRGDVVEIKAAEPRKMPIARLAYLSVLIFFAFGAIFNQGTTGERVLSGCIVGFMAFIVAWIMNRRARLCKRIEFRVVNVVKQGPGPLDPPQEAGAL